MKAPIMAWFEDVEDAKDWRHKHGGWIFASDGKPVIWFAMGFTPSTIFTHPVTNGMSGKLL
jgi:hypothetical protein